MTKKSFSPKYTISPVLLKRLKQIWQISDELSQKSFSDVALFELKQEAIQNSSYASNSIEGNPLPLTEVKNILKHRPKNIRDTEKEVLNYNDTLIWLNDLLKESNFTMSNKSLVQIHERLMSGLLPKIKLGKFRKEPVFVNDPMKRKTIYWPPDHDDVDALMSDLMHFIEKNKEDLDPIILAGIFHKQFVIIHPFVDGNGRSVRVATKALLANLGFDTFHLFSFESYYNKNVSQYFQSVGARGNFYDIEKTTDFSSWLEYFADGIIDELLRIKKELSKIETTPNSILKSHEKAILEFVEKNNYITDKDYSKLTERAKATRALDFKRLIKLGHLEIQGKGPATFYRRK
jgi:Fic family protein